MVRCCSEVDIACYSNDRIAVMLETGIKSRHHLEVRFRKLCRAIAQLGTEKKGRHDMARQTAIHHRSSSTSKKHFRGACWTSSGEPSETRSTPPSEHLHRGHLAFREALDEAKETLAGVRGSQPGLVAARVQKTHISVEGESASVSVSYAEADQTTSSPLKPTPNMGSTHKSGRKEKMTECPVRSNRPRPRSKPEETGRKQPDIDTEHNPVLCPRVRGSCSEGMRPLKSTPRRSKTVYVEAKRGGSDGKGFKVHLQLNNGKIPEGSSSNYNVSNKGVNAGENYRPANTAPCRKSPLHQGLRAISDFKEDPHDQQHSKQRKRTDGYEPLEEWERASSDEDKQREPTVGKLRAGGERCFDGGHEDIEPEGDERHSTYEGVSKSRGGWNQQYSDSTRAEETEEDASDQQRWRNRGRVLWSTHAEPAARATSAGSTRATPHTVRSHSQPATRPYYGLYARSLRANGIDPTSFRSRCGYNAAGSSCAVAQRHVDGSLLWRGNRGNDSFAAERTRAPMDGLPDRLEAGRVLDSLNRRAELLGTMPPTPLRTKAAWMETPGDPEYSLRESSEGLLASFCDPSIPASTSLRAARADRRFANYALCAGKPHVEPATAAATTFLEAANAWSTPYGQRSAHTCVEARLRDETPRVRWRKSTAEGTVGRRPHCPCGASTGAHNRKSHAKLCCRRNGTISAGGAARFVGRLAI